LVVILYSVCNFVLLRYVLTIYCYSVQHDQIDNKKVDKHIKEIKSEIPFFGAKSQIDVESHTRKMNELLLEASLAETLPVCDKISAIIDYKHGVHLLDATSSLETLDLEDDFDSLKVLHSDITEDEDNELDIPHSLEVQASDKSEDDSLQGVTSDKSEDDVPEESMPKKKPKLPKEWIALLQKPQPDPSPCHFMRWPHDTLPPDGNFESKLFAQLLAECSHRINNNLAYLSEAWKIHTKPDYLKVVVEHVQTFENKWRGSSSGAKSGSKIIDPLGIQDKSWHIIRVLQSSVK